LLGKGTTSKSLLEESGKNESSLVKLSVIVVQLHVFGDLTNRNTAGGILNRSLTRLAANDETDLTEGISRDLSGSILNAFEDTHALNLAHKLGDELNILPHGLALSGNLTTSLESSSKIRVERALEESSGGTNGIGSISNDNIKLAKVLRALDVLRSITADELHLLVVPGVSDLREVLLGAVNNHLVDLADVNLLDRLVLEDLADDTTVTTTDNQDSLGVRVREERDVSDGLLVSHFIEISDLDDTIKNEDIAKGLGLEDNDVL